MRNFIRFPRSQFILSLLGQYWHVSDDFKNNSREITASGFRADLLGHNKLPSPSIPNKNTVIQATRPLGYHGGDYARARPSWTLS